MTGAKSRVTRVTFFEDRAQVEREIAITLDKGSHTLVVPDLAPAVDDRSLVARSAGLRVDDIRAVRRWRVGKEEAPEEVRALLEESEMLRRAHAATESAWQRLSAYSLRLQAATTLSFEAMQREMPYLAGFDRAQASAVSELLDEIRKADAELRGVEEERLRIMNRYETVRRRFDELNNPSAQLQCEVRVQVHAGEKKDYLVTLSYMVPSALWRPIHRVVWRNGKVQFECAAAVWQATGEEWSDVDTRFSTARSTKRAEPPLLEDDVLSVRPRPTRQVRATIHEQAITDTGAGMADNMVPGVDDGGETRLMESAHKVTIRSNGRMHRVPLFQFESETRAERIARPELSPLVFLRTEQVNTSRYPLLAGPVELLRDSGNVGFTEIGFIAPGEKFQLSFGGDDGLRIERKRDEHRETAMLTSKQTIRREVRLYLSNLHDTEQRFILEERVPVSELEEVEVKIDQAKTGPTPAPDSEGVVRFDARLDPQERKELALHHVIIAGPDVRGL